MVEILRAWDVADWQAAQMTDAIRRVLRKALQTLELRTAGDLSSPDAHKRRADEHVAQDLGYFLCS